MMVAPLRRRKARVAPAAGLLLLSLLWAAEPLRTGLFGPAFRDRLPHFQRQAILFVLLALVCAVLAKFRGEERPRGAKVSTPILIGLGMFLAPSLLGWSAGGWINGFARTVLFTLVPLFALVLEPYLGGELHAGSHPALLNGSRLSAAIALAAGAFCVFPVEFPASLQAGAAFCCTIMSATIIAATNCIAVSAAYRSYHKSIALLAAISGLTAALGYTVASIFTERSIWQWSLWAPELLWSTVVELPTLLLLFWLMGHMSAVRMATRYGVAPLITILLGALLTQSSMTWRTSLGLLLMALGAGYLLFAPESELEPASLSLR